MTHTSNIKQPEFLIGKSHPGTFAVTFYGGGRSSVLMTKYVAMAYCLMASDTTGVIDIVSNRKWKALQIIKLMKARAEYQTLVLIAKGASRNV